MHGKTPPGDSVCLLLLPLLILFERETSCYNAFYLVLDQNSVALMCKLLICDGVSEIK